MKENQINTRNGQTIRLINHLRETEKSKLFNNYEYIRSFYNGNQLKFIDNLISMFELKNTSFRFNDWVKTDDFDRFI